MVLAFAILAASATVWWVPNASAERIDSAEFIQVLACFRHPHHYLPSTFGHKAYLGALSFFVASAICYAQWRRSLHPASSTAVGILVMTLTVLALCLGGYVFVEIIPTRLCTTAQVFRLLLLPKWVGLVLISGVIASCQRNRDDAPYGLVSLFSLLSPASVGVPHLARVLKKWAKRCMSGVRAFPEQGIAVLLVLWLFLWVGPSRVEALSLVLFCALGLACLRWPQKCSMMGLAILSACLLTVTLFRQQIRRTFEVDQYLPQIMLSELAGDEIDLAVYVREHTQRHSTFLTPPGLGQFRLTANRAIVVDFKAFPFQEVAMLEWRQRLFDAYGTPSSSGWQASVEMEQRYRDMDDARLRTLQSKYHFSYAILYQGTQSQFPVLYENSTYRIVIVPRGATSGQRLE